MVTLCNASISYVARIHKSPNSVVPFEVVNVSAGELPKIGVAEDLVCNVPIPPTSCATNGGLLLAHGERTGTNAALIFVPQLHDLDPGEEVALQDYIGVIRTQLQFCLNGIARPLHQSQFQPVADCAATSIEQVNGAKPLIFIISRVDRLISDLRDGGVMEGLFDEGGWDLDVFMMPHHALLS